mmetsp:Transcript_8676/g.17179  ORF Transcript_8676/g.17179 Transcript_8676/m.17179 type:complete len:148 (+) Transcript_8676:156-599(+)|eukprot:CAMPEP_0171489432 /NCGR_PEP_ID=MMETSP0958-20121227/2754_1 /TAXON_ID=87120 /ORGANISM="Aurantiochytrium limacinum, Strain ATCCMYA-1381" /LENGTH=147 /DNA_ID=CAMNT_0012022645 /DNA_START=83 /DNA_END=526 /DNA_ORIENTATION=+
MTSNARFEGHQTDETNMVLKKYDGLELLKPIKNKYMTKPTLDLYLYENTGKNKVLKLKFHPSSEKYAAGTLDMAFSEDINQLVRSGESKDACFRRVLGPENAKRKGYKFYVKDCKLMGKSKFKPKHAMKTKQVYPVMYLKLARIEWP